MPILSQPESEWIARRPLIEELYTGKGLTMDQVRDHLCQTGFGVNTRMVKNRLLKWNLHKKLSLVEIRTALELLGPLQDSWPSRSPHFRIRRKVVSFEEIVRSCRRRGIQDPFTWIQSTPPESSPSPDVELLTPTTSMGNEAEIIGATYPDGCEVSRHSESELSNASEGASAGRGDDLNVVCSTAKTTQRSGKPSITRLRDPEVYIFGAQAIQQLRSFCLEYAISNTSTAHEEPLVHQFTSHARLQNHVNEGLFQFAKGDVDGSFANFGRAFMVLEEVLDDVHPMAVALYLMLLCTLSTKQADIIAAKLLKHALDLAATRPQIPASLVEALRAIYRSGELLELPMLCLRAASESMASNVSLGWKNFYVKERYCDALYHACLTGEGSVRRGELLIAQESFYGPSARNVLVTSLNVADDHLIQCRLDEAERRFRRVLLQSEDLLGFHRAKIRVVALSGLARAAILRVQQWYDQHYSPIPDQEGHKLALQQLRDAAGCIKEALDLAEIWFEGSARRMKVLHDLQADVLATSLRAGFQLDEGHEV